MSFLSTIPLSELTEAHVNRLVTDYAAESRELEFKQMPYGPDREEKREFLKDVTALANTSGGHLIIGIAEEGGVASSVCPIADRDLDTEKQRLENLLQDGVEPGLIGVQMQQVPITTGGFVLIVYVPRSWNPPHRVLLNDHKFYARHSAGVYSMDVDQLRSVFLGASELAARVRQFRLDRVALFYANEAPATLDRPDLGPNTITIESANASSIVGTMHELGIPRPRGVMLLHLVSLAANTPTLDIMRAQNLTPDFAPFEYFGHQGKRPNLDGLLIRADARSDGSVGAYTQLFRDGKLEAAEVVERQRDRLNPWRMRDALINCLPRHFKGMAALGFGPPYVIMLSLLGVRGARFTLRYETTYPADRDNLLLDAITIDAGQLDGDWHGYLRPLLDMMWNAFGWSKCPDFDDDGKWAPMG